MRELQPLIKTFLSCHESARLPRAEALGGGWPDQRRLQAAVLDAGWPDQRRSQAAALDVGWPDQRR